MSFHQSMTSHEAAVELISADPSRVGDFFDNLFAQQRQKAERIARAREEAKIKDYEEAARRELGIRKNCLKSTEFWRKEFERDPYEASVGFTQLMFVASTKGWNKPVEKPEDETPVMDRTRTARKMASFDPARGGSRATYGLTLQNAYQKEVEETAESIYQKLVNGVPLNRLREGLRAGRPSKAWQEAYQLAYDRFERETDPSLQPEADSDDAAAA